jgi:hypothetical protein
MKVSITCWPRLDAWPGGTIGRYDDALDAMRGVMAGTILSMLLFWMPLAIALTR